MPTRPPIHRPAGMRAPQERRRFDDQQRGTSAQRGYDADWRRVRLRHLQQHPLCLFCEADGRITPATDVDHIVSIAEAPEYRLDPTNLRSLCQSCHSRRTARDQGFGAWR